jgi:hypothetical protein
MKSLASATVLAAALSFGAAASAQDFGGVPGVATASQGQNLSNAAGAAAYGASQYRTEYSFGDLLSRVSEGMAKKLESVLTGPRPSAVQDETAEEGLSVTAL